MNIDRSIRQRAWRERKKARAAAGQTESVMYQGSIALFVVAVSVCQGFLNRKSAVLYEKTMAFRPRCIICRRVGRFVDPFFIKRRHYP
jgi:hypothetical protein